MQKIKYYVYTLFYAYKEIIIINQIEKTWNILIDNHYKFRYMLAFSLRSHVKQDMIYKRYKYLKNKSLTDKKIHKQHLLKIKLS